MWLIIEMVIYAEWAEYWAVHCSPEWGWSRSNCISAVIIYNLWKLISQYLSRVISHNLSNKVCAISVCLRYITWFHLRKTEWAKVDGEVGTCVIIVFLSFSLKLNIICKAGIVQNKQYSEEVVSKTSFQNQYWALIHCTALCCENLLYTNYIVLVKKPEKLKLPDLSRAMLSVW